MRRAGAVSLGARGGPAACRGRGDVRRLQGAGGRAEARRRRAEAGGFARALQLAEARERAGPGGRASGRGLETRHLHPPGLWNFLPGRTPRALPRPTREPRSHHLARRAALAAAVGSSGRDGGGFAVRCWAGCSGAWARSEAGGVPVGDASAGGEGCSLTLTGGPDSLQRLALTATSRHGTGRAEGGASAGRGGAELAGGRHPGTRARRSTRSPTGLLAEHRSRSASAFCVRCAWGY